MKEIPVLFENEDCMVFNKPAGLPVQGGKGVSVSLDSILAGRWTPRPLLVHRLDRDTSGLILVARHREAAARFSRLFAGGAGRESLTKQYLALALGRLSKPEGRIIENIPARPGYGKREREAETRYRVLGEDDGCRNPSCSFTATGYSFLELTLVTGRMHQIRRHLARTGNPIFGDDKYGDFALNRSLRKIMGLKNLLLHSSRLIIPGLLDISAPLPEYFKLFLERIAAYDESAIPN